jgi:hypothetical protein
VDTVGDELGLSALTVSFEEGRTMSEREWKRMQPKEARGIYDDELSPAEARKENRELRKRMARRFRRIEKRSFLEGQRADDRAS